MSLDNVIISVGSHKVSFSDLFFPKAFGYPFIDFLTIFRLSFREKVWGREFCSTVGYYLSDCLFPVSLI